MPPLDRLSMIVGGMERQLASLSESMATLTNSFHTDRELAFQSRANITVVVDKIERQMAEIENQLRDIKPIVDDYKTSRSKVVGFMLALSILASVAGWGLAQIANYFKH